MIEFNPESAAGSCQETGAGGHRGDNEADACDCATCREGLPPPVYRPGNVNGRSTLEILADHWPNARMRPDGSTFRGGN